MNYAHLLPPILSSSIAIILLVIVLIRGRRHPASRIFIGILLISALWGIFMFFMRNSSNIDQALFWDRLSAPAGLVMFILYYHFSLALTRAKHNSTIGFTSYIVLLIILAFYPTNLLIHHMRIESYGYAPIMGIGTYIVIPFGLTFLIMTFYQLIGATRKSSDWEEKNRLRWITVAMIFPVLGSIFEIFPAITPTAITCNIIFCVIAGYSILKYHLFDVRIVFKKGLAYLLISALVAIPYISAIALVSWILGGKQVPLWISVILLILIAFTAHLLWQWVQRFVDKLFYGKRYNSLTALERFSRECTGIIDLNSLSDHLISLTLPAMGASSAHLLMPHGNDMNFSLTASSAMEKDIDTFLDQNSILVRWLEKYDSPLRRSDIDYISPLAAVTSKERALLNMLNADLLVPFKYRDRLNGILALSPKLSTEEYTNDDLDTLMVLARQASTAIENARLYAQSQEMAIKDGITGFYNHSFFQVAAKETINILFPLLILFIPIKIPPLLNS